MDVNGVVRLTPEGLYGRRKLTAHLRRQCLRWIPREWWRACSAQEDGFMPAPRKYPDELRECAVRLVRERVADEPRLPVSRACRLVGEQVGINGDTLRNWVKHERVDAGALPGRTSSDVARIAELEKENRELRRANTILRQASAYFSQAGLDRR